MVKYAKQRRTEKRGLRTPSTLDNFPQKKIQKWTEKLQDMLSHNGLVRKDRFLLEYARTVCRFRLAVIKSEDTMPFLREINKLANRGHSFGFDQEDFQAINRIFRDKGKGELEQYCQILEAKQRAE
jgi:hypothetical protein